MLGRVLSVMNLVNQSFFMCLFFFISGFFVPSSLQRKGAMEFLKDKFMRLGVPLVFGGLVLFPLTAAFSWKAAFGTEWYPGLPAASGVLHKPDVWYIVGLGPLWFLEVLLVFNLAFCCIYPKGLESMPGGIPLPGFFESLFIGTVLGFFQGWSFQDSWGWKPPARFSFLDVPNTYAGGGGLPFNIVFFFAGALAKKNNWLEQILEKSAPPSTSETADARDIAVAHDQADMLEKGNLRNRDSQEPSQKGRVDGNAVEVENLKKKKAARRSRCCWNLSVWGYRLHAVAMIAVTAYLAVVIDPKMMPPQHSKCGNIVEAEVSRWKKLGRIEMLASLYSRDDIHKAERNIAGKGGVEPEKQIEALEEEAQTRAREKAAAAPARKWYEVLELNKGNSIIWHMLRGQMTMTISFALVELFSRYGNTESKTAVRWNATKKAMGEAAYGVYLLHWVVWPLFLWALLAGLYHRIMDPEVDKLEFKICADRMFAADGPFSPRFKYGLFFLTLFCTNALLWPLCYYLRKIPGLDKVL
ncbi:unnamed protein product [Amoebophrya sp. A25]|nr:unnamed protein product [Amoebophrya sp. A25]|eukprot:GSA25T00005347001.1